MAQRDHKQEEPTELRAPEITLCANSCGFPGNPATHNLCQNCFLAGPASASPSPASAPSSSASSSSSSSLPGVSAVLDRPWPAPAEAAEPGLSAVDLAPAATVEAKQARASANRCSSCRKKVGLTGFRCRCGDMFCGEHRYSDRHGCSYDYKAAARDAIARDNPVVRAAKIVRF